MYYSKKDYKFIDFEKSTRKNKKYAAILEDKKTNVKIKVHFGDSRYEQYEDIALKLYSNLDHKDIKRRDNFRRRHKNFIKEGYYSPSYFSYYYLW